MHSPTHSLTHSLGLLDTDFRPGAHPSSLLLHTQPKSFLFFSKGVTVEKIWRKRQVESTVACKQYLCTLITFDETCNSHNFAPQHHITHHITQHNTTQHNTTQHNTTQHNTMLCVICQDNAEEALGVACSGGGSERHFVCGECLEQYVRQESAEQDITRLSYREGHILCPLAPKSLSDTRNAHHLTCRNSVHYSPVTLQNLLTQQTYAQYTAALAKVAEQNGYVQSLSTASQQSQDDEHNAMLAEQIRRLMPDARQCHQCHHGPIDIYACSNLQTHHQQRISSSKSGRHSVINNSCPMCGWFSNTRHDWPKWNGKLVDGVSRPIERKKKPPLILAETFIISFVLFAVLVYLWSVGDSVYYQDQFRLSWKIMNTIFSPFGRILQFSWHHCVQHICGGFVTCLKGVKCLIHAVTQVLMSVVRAVCSVMVHKILPYVWQSLASGAQVLMSVVRAVCSVMVHKILPYVWQSLASGAQVLMRGGSVVCSVMAVSACKILPFVWQVFTSGTTWLGGIALQGMSGACSFTAFKVLPYVWQSLTSMV